MKSGIAVAPQSPSLLPVALLVETAPRSEPEGVGGLQDRRELTSRKKGVWGRQGPPVPPAGLLAPEVGDRLHPTIPTVTAS